MNLKTITEKIKIKRSATAEATVCMTARENYIKMAIHFKFE